MATYLEALGVQQWAKETVAGTLVAATSKIACIDFNVIVKDSLDDPQILNSLAIGNKGYEIVLQRWVEWEIAESPLDYNQIQSLFSMAIAGAVITGVGPYTHTSTGDPTSPAFPHVRTIEARLTDGTTPSDWKLGYAMLTDLTITCAADATLRFSAKGFARVLTTATITAALALPLVGVLSEEPAALSSLYIDSAFGGIGGTIVTGQGLGWKWTFTSGWQPRWTTDARSTLDYTVAELDPKSRKAMLEITMLATPAGQWATEKTAAEALALRAVELRAVNGANSLKIQGLYKHKPVPSLLPTQADKGQIIAVAKLESSTDQANWLKTIVINGTAAVI